MIKRKAKHRIKTIILKKNISKVAQIIDIIDNKSKNHSTEVEQNELEKDRKLCSQIYQMKD